MVPSPLLQATRPEKTLRNVLRMLTLLNRPDISAPSGGAWKPLMDPIIADNVHGESGLDGLEPVRAGLCAAELHRTSS